MSLTQEQFQAVVVGLPWQCIENQARDLKYKLAKLEKVMFELTLLKAWRFSART